VTDTATDTSQAAISLTKKAADKIAELLGGQEDSAGQALRVAVRGGGCSGFQYDIKLDEAHDDDLVLQRSGQTVLVDAVSLPFLTGAVIDFDQSVAGCYESAPHPAMKGER
jgi:iron-sulfur cluster assembly accessory protein